MGNFEEHLKRIIADEESNFAKHDIERKRQQKKAIIIAILLFVLSILGLFISST